MNNTEPDFEKILRDAPRPEPTAGLKEKLLRDAAPLFRKTSASRTVSVHQPNWFRRWWPAFAPAMVSAACVVVLAVQQMEIRDLKASLRALAPAPEIQSSQAASTTGGTAVAVTVEPAEETDELTRLKSLAAKLNAEVASLEQMQTENEKLRARLAAPVTPTFSPEETDAMNKARERALAIQCVNNMKQIGLAARVWSLDNGDAYPTNFLSMSNELSTPKILVCPADTNRVVAPNFSTYTDANASYEFFNASETEPNQILCRCPIHGSITLADGSVQMGVAKKHPEWVVQRDGKLYYDVPNTSAPAPATQNPESSPRQ